MFVHMMSRYVRTYLAAHLRRDEPEHSSQPWGRDWEPHREHCDLGAIEAPSTNLRF